MFIQPQRTMKARPKFSKTKTTWFETHIKTMGLRPKPNHHTIHITKFTAKCCFNLQQSTKIRWLLQNEQLHHSQQLLLYEILTLTTPIPESFSLSSNQSSYTATTTNQRCCWAGKTFPIRKTVSMSPSTTLVDKMVTTITDDYLSTMTEKSGS